MSKNSAASPTPFQLAEAQSSPASKATQGLLIDLLSKDVTIPEPLLIKAAAIATKPGMDDLAVALAKRKGLTSEIAHNLAVDTRLDVRRAYISSPLRTVAEIRAAIAAEKRPTALGDIIDDKSTSEAVVEVLAERDSTLLAMKILERKTATTKAVLLALSTLDKAKRSLTWQASANLQNFIKDDQSIAQYIADNLTRPELLTYSEKTALTPDSFSRISELLVTAPLSKVVKLKSTSYGYEYAGDEIRAALNSAKSLMNNLDIPPTVGVQLAKTLSAAFKKMGPGAKNHQGSVEAVMNKFATLDVELLANLPKLTPDEIKLAATSKDTSFLSSALLAAELMLESFQNRSLATAAALITNPNLPEELEPRTLLMITGNYKSEPLHKLHKLTLPSAPSAPSAPWAKRRVAAILLAHQELTSSLDSLDPWLIDLLSQDQLESSAYTAIWRSVLRNKQTTQYAILNAPWEILTASLSSQNATLLAELINSYITTPDRWSIFDQLQGGFKGTTAELLDTITSLAG